MAQLVFDDKTDFNYLVPVTNADGQFMFMSKTTGESQLLFYQIRKKSGNHVDKLDVFAAIKFQNKEDLKSLNEMLERNINPPEREEP